jgi:hypothetical protein
VNRGVAFLDDPESRELLRVHCERAGIDLAIVEELVREEVDVVGLQRRDGLHSRMHDIIRNSVGLDDDAAEGEG